ncbi:alpha/beta fold hydrolase [Acidobacteria bacterium AB60]|nr:alpha/beta fold hydrolase [Acidobacteria bacterium AB60]
MIEAMVEGSQVRGYLHRAESSTAGLVLTHGAGANCRSLLLSSLAEAFRSAGVTVLRCDLPFRQERAQGPPMRGSAEKDQAGLRSAAAFLRSQCPGRVILGGHSYGGRQATMLSAADPIVADGLLLLSYPLHPPERPEQMRTQHFPSLRTPAVFFHGTRDGFGSIAEMEAALKLIPAETQLVPVEAAGHELLSKKNRDSLTQMVIDVFHGMFGKGSPQRM